MSDEWWAEKQDDRPRTDQVCVAVYYALAHVLCLRSWKEEGRPPILDPTDDLGRSCRWWGGVGGTVLWLWTTVHPLHAGPLLQVLAEGGGLLNFSSAWVGLPRVFGRPSPNLACCDMCFLYWRSLA